MDSLGDRLRLFFGFLPSDIECRARVEDSGHIRAFVKSNIKDILKENGFKSIEITGRDFYLPFIKHNMKYLGKINEKLSDLFPSLSAGFIIRAKKR